MKVAIVDLLTQTPFYDRYLARAISPLVDELTLYGIRWHREPGYLDDPSYVRSPGLVDLVGKLRIHNQSVRQVAKFGEYILNWQYLVTKFRREPPDVVHIQWLPMLERSRFQLEFVRQIQKLGLPVVYTVHNFLPHDVDPGQAYEHAYHLVDHLIVHTHEDARRLRTELGLAGGRVSVVPQGPVFYEQTGIDRTEARRHLDMDSNAVVFLMMGVIRPYKGLDTALRAFANLVRNQPDSRLLIAGNPLDARYLRELQELSASLKLESFIDWHLGYVPSEAVGLFHAASDVALFPYKAISQSAAFLTAAALGTCVLGTNVGGIGEVVADGKTGLLVETAEHADVVSGMRRALALTREQREHLGQALREQVLSEFSWARIAARTVEVYESVSRRSRE